MSHFPFPISYTSLKTCSHSEGRPLGVLFERETIMSYSTQQDILDFVEDNNVKFVRFAFCDIFGTQKNIAVLANDLPKALEDGVCFDGSSIAGFMKVE